MKGIAVHDLPEIARQSWVAGWMARGAEQDAYRLLLRFVRPGICPIRGTLCQCTQGDDPRRLLN